MQKPAYEMRISDWSSDVCSSDLAEHQGAGAVDRPGDAERPGRQRHGKKQHGIEQHLPLGRRLAGHHRQHRHPGRRIVAATRSEEHTSELQSLMRISYAAFCLKKIKHITPTTSYNSTITTLTHT